MQVRSHLSRIRSPASLMPQVMKTDLDIVRRAEDNLAKWIGNGLVDIACCGSWVPEEWARSTSPKTPS